MHSSRASTNQPFFLSTTFISTTMTRRPVLYALLLLATSSYSFNDTTCHAFSFFVAPKSPEPLATTREPAGAESLFARANKMSAVAVKYPQSLNSNNDNKTSRRSRIVSKLLPRRYRNWRMQRASRKNNDQESMISMENDMPSSVTTTSSAAEVVDASRQEEHYSIESKVDAAADNKTKQHQQQQQQAVNDAHVAAKTSKTNDAKADGASKSFNANVLDLPDWAITDPQEEQSLLQLKQLLKPDYAKLSSRTVDITAQLDGTPMASTTTMSVVQAFPDVYSDFRLLRFLRKESPQDVQVSAERFRHFIDWRIEHNIDTKIRARVQSEPFRQLSQHVEELLPCDFDVQDTTSIIVNGDKDNDGGDNNARVEVMIPIVLSIGDWDTGKILKMIQKKQLSMDDFLDHWTYLFESLHLKLYQHSMKNERMIFVDEIADLTNMSLTQLGPKFVSTVLKPWIKLMQDYYPETTKRIGLLHPPAILRMAWSIVTKFVSPGTVAKIKLYNKNDFDGTTAYDFVKHNPQQ